MSRLFNFLFEVKGKRLKNVKCNSFSLSIKCSESGILSINLGSETVIGSLSFAFSSNVLPVGLGSKPEKRKVEISLKTRLSFSRSYPGNSATKQK